LTIGASIIFTKEVTALQPVVELLKLKSKLPDETPVTTPALVTVALLLLLLDQVPPVVGDKVIVPPTQTVGPALTTGKAVTVTAEVFALQPVVLFVKVNIALPAAIPVTIPALVTVALVRSLLDQVPPVTGEIVIVLPTHTDDPAETIGEAITV
jgi:hypothetical protein